MLRRNLDTAQGLVNGACGTVLKIHQDASYKVTKLTVLWDHGFESEVNRFTAQYEVATKIFTTRSQFPLVLAYAVTIHKCQGLSLDRALVYAGQHLFDPAMGYVALSRVRRLQQVDIVALNPAKLYADKDAILQYNRLRTTINMPLLAQCNQLPTSVLKNYINVKRKLPIPKTVHSLE